MAAHPVPDEMRTRLLCILLATTALACNPSQLPFPVPAPRWDSVAPQDSALIGAVRSLDGRRVALMDRTGQVAVWQVRPSRLLARFQVPGPQPLSASLGAQAFLLDQSGEYVVVGGSDGRLRVYGVETGRQVWSASPTPPGTRRRPPSGAEIDFVGTRPVQAMAVSPDAARIVTGEGSMLLVWDLATGRRVDSVWIANEGLGGHEARRLDFSPADGSLRVATRDGWLYSYDLGTLRIQWRRDVGLVGPHLLVTSSGGALTAFGGSWDPPAIALLDGARGGEICRFNIPLATKAAAFGPNARALVLGGGRGEINVISTGTCEIRHRLVGFPGAINAVWFGPDCASIIVGLGVSGALYQRSLPWPPVGGC